jgi:hypothetical protein
VPEAARTMAESEGEQRPQTLAGEALSLTIVRTGYELFSRRAWADAAFCPAQVAAHAVSTTVVHGR